MEGKREIKLFLKSSQLFPASSPSIDHLSKIMKKVTYSKHDVICRNECKCQAFWFVLQGEILCQYYPPVLGKNGRPEGNIEKGGYKRAANAAAADSGGGIVGSTLQPSHDISVILTHDSVLSEDCLIGSLTYDTTAIAISDTVVCYRVPKEGWKYFRTHVTNSRYISLLYKDRIRADRPFRALSNATTLHKRFKSIREIIAKSRPHRGVISWDDYNVENKRRAEISDTKSSKAGSLNNRDVEEAENDDGGNRLEDVENNAGGGTRRTLLKSKSTGHFMEDESNDDDPLGTPKLDPWSFAHLGESLRKASTFTDSQKRFNSKEEASLRFQQTKQRMKRIMNKSKSQRGSSMGASCDNVTEVNKRRREQNKTLDHTALELHAVSLISNIPLVPNQQPPGAPPMQGASSTPAKGSNIIPPSEISNNLDGMQLLFSPTSKKFMRSPLGTPSSMRMSPLHKGSPRQRAMKGYSNGGDEYGNSPTSMSPTLPRPTFFPPSPNFDDKARENCLDRAKERQNWVMSKIQEESDYINDASSSAHAKLAHSGSKSKASKTNMSKMSAPSLSPQSSPPWPKSVSSPPPSKPVVSTLSPLSSTAKVKSGDDGGGSSGNSDNVNVKKVADNGGKEKDNDNQVKKVSAQTK